MLFHWDFIKSIFLAGFADQVILNEDSTFWIDGTRLPSLILLDLLLPENEFGKVII
jgi:hypothetical protein